MLWKKMGNWAFNEYFSNAITKEGLKGLVKGEKKLRCSLKDMQFVCQIYIPQNLARTKQ